jgi:uncharacterized membrane protein
MISVEHIHPILVHFPIVFFLTLAVFDLVSIARRSDVTGRSVVGGISAGLAVLSGLSAVAALYFGGVALEVAESHGFHSQTAEIHEGLGEATAAVLFVWALVRGFLWWRRVSLTGAASMAVPAVEIAGAALVVLTAYFGGTLVYDLGVNVARAAGAG